VTTFQLLLLIVSGVIFYRFFRQLFQEDYPKRGVDFEAKVADEQIGGISRADKILSKPTVPVSRLKELHKNADDAIGRGDYEEAIKALESARIVDDSNTDTLYKLAFAYLNTEQYHEAKNILERLLILDDRHDMAHAMLANVLHYLHEDDLAIAHHLRAIELDNTYAPHYFNYANTLYDMGRNEEARDAYQKAYALDHTLDTAKEMILRLSEK